MRIRLHTLVLPTPFAVGPINVYLAEGKELTLIDTGINTHRTMTALREGLAERGYTVADIQRIIITHAHVDHHGLARAIVEESGARVYTHRYNRYWLEDYQAERRRRYEFYAQILRLAGLPPKVRATILEISRGLKRFNSGSVPLSGLLEEGDVLSLGGCDWQVLHTPGHAGGVICLYQPEARVMLSSDHLLRDITSNPVLEPPPRGSDQRPLSLVNYLASLKRVEEMKIDVVLPAHGEPIYDHRQLIVQRHAFHEERKTHIVEAIGDGEATICQICRHIFPGLSPLDTFLAVSEVIGHLDLLELEGKVKAEEREGVAHWTPVST